MDRICVDDKKARDIEDIPVVCPWPPGISTSKCKRGLMKETKRPLQAREKSYTRAVISQSI